MNAKNICASIMAVLLVVTLVPLASAYLEIEQVRINGDVANDYDDLYVERGDEIKIRVVLQAEEEVRQAYLGAYLSGYRYAHYEPNMVMTHTNTFNVPAGNKRAFDLTLKVPMDMQQKDAKLRLILFDENSDSVITYNYQLSIYGSDERAAVQIRNFFVSPSDSIEAGRALSFKVQVKNYGNYDLDHVTVKVAIPELNIQTYETIDWLKKEETQSFESLLLRIPQDAKAQDYEVIATVEYDRFQVTSQKQLVTVTRTESLEKGVDGVSVITMPESVQVIAGSQQYQGSLYPILIENKGASSKTYVLSVSGHEGWATATFEPSSVFVVKGGQSQTAYLRLRADDDVVAGDKILKISVASGEEMQETTVLASVKNLEEKTVSDWNTRQVLEWALVILIIVLIVLGLVVVFKKMRKNNDDEDDQTYY
ncbi:hypothetical protein KO361_02740 [Candidatus Woesearchaeota archaeon]|nr:hypothetical protein [Candidatus Woesearchaeota archaeon]